MRFVTRRMLPLETSFAFVGGAVVPLLVDHPDLTEFRPTKDVDLVTQVVTLAEFYAFEEKLRHAGFRHDHSDGAPPFVGGWLTSAALTSCPLIHPTWG